MKDGITGASAVVDAGLDAARQSLFDAADVPLARTDELLAAVAGAAVGAVLGARIEQIVKYGHVANRDDDVGARILASNARTMILEGIDVAGGPNRNLVVARRRFARGAAMMLAAIDALDRAVARAEREARESDGA